MEKTAVSIKVITGSKSLKYHITKKRLSSCQTCSTKILSEFNFFISYTSGKKHQKRDSPTDCGNNFS